jgi:hypothetical protein
MLDLVSPGTQLPAVIAAAGATVVALITATAAFFASKRDRRRQLYGEAYRAAMAWREMLYRVRRRQADKTSELIDRSHDIQEQIYYYTGWIGSESKLLQRSYIRLVQKVKSETKGPLQVAWETQPPEGVHWRSLEAETHPNVELAADQFLRDVRNHLSAWQVPKLLLVWRNRAWRKKLR